MKKYIFLFIIIFLAAVLRLWHLGEVPPSPNWDEVALGYNAYSIRETGKDEYGKPFPIILRSYDDYKPALYSYLAIPSITLFGLSAFAVRLPSAIFGVLTVLITYALVMELFLRNTVKKELTDVYRTHIALFAALLLAISPWHIQFSRIAFESNIGLAFNVIGIYFFFLGLRKPYALSFATLSWALALYVYQSEKVFTPLIAFVLICLFCRELFKLPKRFLIVAALLGVIIAFPMLYVSLTDKQALARAKGVSVFSDTTHLLEQSSQRLALSKEKNDFLGIIFNNRRVVFAKTVMSNYLSHYDLNWLFITGDLARHHAPDMGLLYIMEIPFFLLGIYVLAWESFSKKIKLFLLLWFLIAPIPASITSGVPHAVRTLNFLPTFQIITALGIIGFFFYTGRLQMGIKKYLLMVVFLPTVFILSIINFSYYLNQYFVQQNKIVSQDWQFGYKETVEEVKKIEKNYKKIVVSNVPHLDQSYMFFLFYLQYPPIKYQEASQNSSGGFRENHSFDKYEFRPIDWKNEKRDAETLFVGLPSDFSTNAEEIKTVYFLNGKPSIKIVR